MITATTPHSQSVQPLLLPVDPSLKPAKIAGIRKAAILLMALDDDLSKLLLQSLSEHDVQRVTDEITRMGDVPFETLRQVVTEFYSLLETQQHMVRGGQDYALRVLTEAFGMERAQQLMEQVRELQERSNGDVAVLQDMDPVQLSKFLENENPQTIALVLAHLQPHRGSALLMALKPETRVEAVQRLAEMRHFSPEMASKVALVLAKRMDSVVEASKRRSLAGFKSVADVLNLMDQNASKHILEAIEQKEPKTAIGIRDLMFTFEDLMTIPQSSVREILARADKRALAMALKGAKEGMRAHLFSAMSSRAVEMLQEDMESMGPVRGKDVTAAQQELLAVARTLEAEGKIILRMENDGEFTV